MRGACIEAEQGWQRVVFFLQDLLWAGELFVTLHLVHGGVALLTLPVCHDRGTVQLVRKRALRPRT
jgi:hypothetical protein